MSKRISMKNPFDHGTVHLLAEDLRKTKPIKEVPKNVAIIQGFKNDKAKKEKNKEIRKS